MKGPEQETNPEATEPLVERLKRRFGPEVDPEISLGGEPNTGTVPLEGRDRQPSSRTPSSGVLERLGERRPIVSRYRLDGEIARGGMGAILRIWDEDLRRPLAMKVALGREGRALGVKPEEIDPRVVARFLEEAQITGQLEHPGIVPVHELGLDASGQLFFTMRLVKGRNLARIFKLVARGEEGWSVTRALGVMQKVCEAVAFAHTKGVIHRDLKPANVMVGRFGEVYVMDWGVARVFGREDRHDPRPAADPAGPNVPVAPVATDLRENPSTASGEALYTMDGEVIGTPSYMAPEQARGPLEALDARCDVYSAGAMLYRLFTGVSPYVPPGETRTASQVLLDLWNRPPEPVEKLAPSTPAELVAICEKAMARDPADRYPDMLALAEDLRAYLEHRVVRAYETGAIAETRKWVRRNKPLAASLAAGVLALASGLVATLVLKDEADDNARLAEQRRVEAEKAADLAEERRVQANEIAKAALRQAQITAEVNGFLNEDLLAAVAPDREGIDVTVREVLDTASGRLEGRFADEPLIEADLRTTIGTSFLRLGEYDRALPHLSRALELRRENLGERAEPTLDAMSRFASALIDLGRVEEARAFLEELIARYRETLGEDHPATLSARCDLGLALSDLGRFDEARTHYEAVLADQIRILGREHDETVTTLNNLGALYQDEGLYPESEKVLREVVELRKKRFGNEHPETLTAMNNLALTCTEMGQFDEAEAVYRETQEIRKRVLGPDHPDYAVGFGNLGDLYSKQGRLADAQRSIEQGVEILKKALGEDHPETLNALNNLAVCHSRQGRHEKALAIRTTALESQRRVLGREHPRTLLSASNLAILYMLLGRNEDSEKLHQETIALQRKVLGADHPDTLTTLENYGNLLYSKGDYEGSDAKVLEVLEGRKRAYGDQHPAVARTIFNRAMIKDSAGEGDAAIELLKEALAMHRSVLGSSHPATIECLKQLGTCLVDASKTEAAIDLYREAIESLRAMQVENEDLGYLLHQLAYCHSDQERYEPAIEFAGEAVAVRRRLHGDAHKNTLTSIYLLAKILTQADRYDEAEPLAVEVYEAWSEAGRRSSTARRGRSLLVEVYEALGKTEELERLR